MTVSDAKTHRVRTAILIGLCVVMCVAASIRVFEYQIVDGAGYLKQAKSGTTTEIEVPAARGKIVDRNGVVLVDNAASYNIEFDFLAMEKENRLTLDNDATNKLIYTLIRLFEDLSEIWEDSLPVTLETPYEFLPDSDTEIARLKKKVGVNDYATAENCMEWLFQETGIKKYRDEDGNCTHCGEPYDSCTYEGYSEEYARKIAGVRYMMLSSDFSAYNTRYTFAKDVSASTVALLRELSDDLPGVTVSETSERVYLNGDVASNLLGNVTKIYDGEYETKYKDQFSDNPGKQYKLDDVVGRGGIEEAFEEELRGTRGTMTVTQNAQGDIIEVQESSAPIAGQTVQLTIDYALQKELQTIFAEYIDWYNSTSDKHSTNGAMVLLDAKTGGVLTSISYPYYDMETYLTDYKAVESAEGSPLNNLALSGLFRPGSTFKPIVAVAGLEEGYITPDTTFYCNGDYYTYYAPDWTPNCVGTRHKGGAYLDASTALYDSCNSFFYDLGRRMGVDLFNKYAEGFGLGVSTGIEVSNAEASSCLSHTDDPNWQAGNAIQAAIGQMNTQVTPLQMAVEAMTLANKGKRYQVHLLDSLLDESGNVVEEYEPSVLSEISMSESTYNEVSEGMNRLAESFPSPYQITDLEELGYEVYAKTGTPQVTSTRTHHCFIAYVLKDGEPEFAVSVLVYDGSTTQRLLRDIILAYDKATYPENYPEEESETEQAEEQSATESSTVSENAGN